MATTSGRPPIFVDTNVLIRANVQSAPKHGEALAALKHLRNQETVLWISRQVLREFMASVTREQTFMKPLAAPLVDERIKYFEARFNVAEDGALVTKKLCEFLLTIPIGGKQIHDANIVATMVVHGLNQLFSLNPIDFERFSAHISVLTLPDVLPDAGKSDQET